MHTPHDTADTVMRLTRCYVESALKTGETLALSESIANRLVRVLRLRLDDECVLFNGDGHDYHARITHIDKRGVAVLILGSSEVDRESPLRTLLIQGIARGEKMDLILQKAAELGVTEIIPVFGERTEVRLTPERREKRTAHWLGVIESACAQCGRASLPSLAAPTTLKTAVQALSATPLKLMLAPEAAASLHTLPDPMSPPDAIAVAIGPEGGWSPADRAILADSGFIGLRLGPRILRTETAGLAAIAILQAQFGDMN